MSRGIILALLLVGTVMSHVSVPLTKRVISSDSSSYEHDHVFTVNVHAKQPTEQTLQAVIDLQTATTWVVDSTCPNCYTGASKSSYTCGSSCGDSVTDAQPQVLFGNKVRVAKHHTVSTPARIGGANIKLVDSVDITMLKDNAANQAREYISQSNAGLGFSLDSVKAVNNSLPQLIASNKDAFKTFSLFFNQEMGRLIVGESEKFFAKNEGQTVHTVESDTWSVLVAPYIQLGADTKAPKVSANSEESPSETSTKDLLSARLDSTTKFITAPLAVWDRLNKLLFSHNNCQEDVRKNQICDCTGSWTTINLELVKNPVESTLVDNTARFTLAPETYLEKTSDSNKCLLLIKSRQSDANLDFVFGTSFLQNFYTIFDTEKQTVTLADSHGFVPTSKHINDTLLWTFVGIGAFLAIALTAALFLILKKVKLSEEDQILLQPKKSKEAPVQRNISYLVTSPREIESIQQITKAARIQAPIGTPIHARVIASPQRTLAYSNHNLVQYP